MTSILALDTSSENCSVALSRHGEIHQLLEFAPRNHTKLILPMIQALLAQQGLQLSAISAIGFGCGPGSFTGIRIAAGVAQGLAFGLNVPIYAISNLQALALQSYLQLGVPRILATIDARMGEVYWGLFSVAQETVKLETGGETIIYRVTPLLDEQVSAPEAVSIPDAIRAQCDHSAWAAIGSGLAFADSFPESVRACLTQQDASAQPQAEALARLTQTAILQGLSGNIEDALPSYVRDTVTWNKLPGRE